MRKRNEAKPIQGWGWLGDAAEEAAVEAVAPARRTVTGIKVKRKGAAGQPGVLAKPGSGTQLREDGYRQLAKQRYESEGKIEIDPHGRVSRSEDRGAWVQAWVFVAKPERT